MPMSSPMMMNMAAPMAMPGGIPSARGAALPSQSNAKSANSVMTSPSPLTPSVAPIV